MTHASLIWDARLADHDLGESHPFDPRRLLLTVGLMEAYGLLGEGRVVAPRRATEAELMLVHSARYIETVLEAGDWGAGLNLGAGLGTDDNPVYPGMHETASLTCGATILGLETVLSGEMRRTFAIAGGLHHAHRGRAAGFSVYNDPAVAIAVARAAHPGLRVMYVDIDAHHGDGVQEAFAGTRDVLTVSVHESGLWLFPGTGFPGETGYDAGEGYAVNVPLPPFAGDESVAHAFERVIEPIARAFVPDVIVAQLGIDMHHLDPQADLVATLPGYRSTVRRIIGLADELCDGRIAATGGGGYNLTTVPRAWTWAFAELSGVELPEELPAQWTERVAEMGLEVPADLGASDRVHVPEHEATAALVATGETIVEARRRLFGYHGLEA